MLAKPGIHPTPVSNKNFSLALVEPSRKPPKPRFNGSRNCARAQQNFLTSENFRPYAGNPKPRLQYKKMPAPGKTTRLFIQPKQNEWPCAFSFTSSHTPAFGAC